MAICEAGLLSSAKISADSGLNSKSPLPRLSTIPEADC